MAQRAPRWGARSIFVTVSFRTSNIFVDAIFRARKFSHWLYLRNALHWMQKGQPVWAALSTVAELLCSLGLWEVVAEGGPEHVVDALGADA